MYVNVNTVLLFVKDGPSDIECKWKKRQAIHAVLADRDMFLW